VDLLLIITCSLPVVARVIRMRGDTRLPMQHALAYYVISTAWSIFEEIGGQTLHITLSLCSSRRHLSKAELLTLDLSKAICCRRRVVPIPTSTFIDVVQSSYATIAAMRLSQQGK
jgi:hypothetical protein